MPGGIPYIIVNDVAERFSFYGVRAILVIFMTQYLMTGDGVLNTYSEEDATSYFHLFTATAYFLPLLGAILADAAFGKYRTIIFLSLVYCAGHFALFLDDTQHDAVAVLSRVSESGLFSLSRGQFGEVGV